MNPLSLDPACEWWTRDEVATYCGIGARAVSNYATKGLMPAPEYVGRTPMWDAALVKAWKAARPGKGRWASSRRKRAQDSVDPSV